MSCLRLFFSSLAQRMFVAQSDRNGICSHLVLMVLRHKLEMPLQLLVYRGRAGHLAQHGALGQLRVGHSGEDAGVAEKAVGTNEENEKSSHEQETAARMHCTVCKILTWLSADIPSVRSFHDFQTPPTIVPRANQLGVVERRRMNGWAEPRRALNRPHVQ